MFTSGNYCQFRGSFHRFQHKGRHAMLKVADLQTFLGSLTQPMKGAGASQKVLDDLAQMSHGLERFKDRSIAEFNDFLQTACNYITHGTLPEPGRRASRRSSPKAAAMSVA